MHHLNYYATAILINSDASTNAKLISHKIFYMTFATTFCRFRDIVNSRHLSVLQTLHIRLVIIRTISLCISMNMTGGNSECICAHLYTQCN